MNFVQMKELLKYFPYLTHLEIECESETDLCNGYQWESFILKELPHLTTFYFKFKSRSMAFPSIFKNRGKYKLIPTNIAIYI